MLSNLILLKKAVMNSIISKYTQTCISLRGKLPFAAPLGKIIF